MTATSQPRDGATGFEPLLAGVLASAYRLARNLARDAAEAEDVVQDAALRAYRKFDTFAPGTNFKAWFFRILTNCFLHRRRHAGRERRVELPDDQDLYLFEQMHAAGLYQAADDPAGLLMSKLTGERIRDAIAALPDEYRIPVALCFLEEMRYHEIAEVTGTPVGTVRSRLHRGRKILQQHLWRAACDAGLVSERGDRHGRDTGDTGDTGGAGGAGGAARPGGVP